MIHVVMVTIIIMVILIVMVMVLLLMARNITYLTVRASQHLLLSQLRELVGQYILSDSTLWNRD